MSMVPDLMSCIIHAYISWRVRFSLAFRRERARESDRAELGMSAQGTRTELRPPRLLANGCKRVDNGITISVVGMLQLDIFLLSHESCPSYSKFENDTLIQNYTILHTVLSRSFASANRMSAQHPVKE